MEQLTLRQLLDAYQGQEAASKKYVRDYLPMFRDSDAQGVIGARAYLYYFQDMSTLHLHQMGKGNDTLPNKNMQACGLYKTAPHGDLDRKAG